MALAPITATVSSHMSCGEDVAMVKTSNGHDLQYGVGSGGDGFCYGHQSFECMDNLSPEEKAAIDAAWGGECE